MVGVRVDLLDIENDVEFRFEQPIEVYSWCIQLNW